MGLTRTIGTAAVLVGVVATGVLSVAQAAHADGIEKMITPGSVASVQLLGDGKVLTADEAAIMLESEGFEVIETERTLLGRIRIVAEGPQGQREIVLHAGDGRVMRDIFTESERPAAVIRPAETVAPSAAVAPPRPPAPVSAEPPLADEPPPAAPSVVEQVEPETAPETPEDLAGAAP